MRSIKQLADNHSRYYYDPAIAKVARDSYEKGAKCVLDNLLVKLQKAKVDNNVCDERYCCVIDDIVPELKENKEPDDEKIRKGLIELVKQSSEILEKKNQEQMIDWLEKQGEHTNKVEPNFKVGDKIQFLRECGTIMTIEKIENGEYIFKDNMGHVSIEEGNKWHLVEEQKSTDKVKPKFHEGEWIIRNNEYTGVPVKVIEFKGYYHCDLNGEVVTLTLNDVHNNFHLWTIQDAKDGDVLSDGDMFVIFKSNNYDPMTQHGCMFVYCSMMKNNSGWHEFWYESGGLNPTYYLPATKEQCEILFQKMREAGYEWDAEKKELKEIDYHCTGVGQPKEPTGTLKEMLDDKEMKELLRTEYEKGRADAIAEMQKPWSEEDTNMLGSILSTLDICSYNPDIPADVREIHKKEEAWLSELYNRIVPQPKQEWSEEDENMLTDTEYLMRVVKMENRSDNEYQRAENCINWLKSLRPQNRWKPSEGQLECLGYAIEKAEKDWSPLTNNRIYLTLKALKEQLLELRGSKV